ncbi:MAG TPA: NADH-ubiquinone oxidoreductase-F iron-sulfur binding region domain-containing protein [Acidimicrobiia bacterium]|nr:NADH-ubiquinone oxidoreductase-F iron-sulfur binding region domain-containing protein [Acidimicrobiia bacterium]
MPTPQELAVVASVAPPAVVEETEGRVVRSSRDSLRHLLLPTLDAVQSEIGHISRGAVDAIAVRLDIPPAEIFSVASFYALLATEARPDTVVHVCDDTACRAAGATELLAAFAGRDDVTASPCLGQCDRRPAIFAQRAGHTDQVFAPADHDSVDAALGGADAVLTDPHVHRGPLLSRVGTTDPTSLDSYRTSGGYQALVRAIDMGADQVIAEITSAGLRGRGGAAFPTGIKWQGVREQPSTEKYVVCNADESEPGTFKDRVLMEGDPFAIIEALTIAGLTLGAHTGFLYIRGEYPVATGRLREAIDEARTAGLLGSDVLGTGFAFDIDLRRGQGAYICGEETALFNSIEGFRGEPRQKPPFPTTHGLFGKPTVINNVETLVNVNRIMLEGGDAYAATGTKDSTGTRLWCLSGDVTRPGVYEAEFGATLGDMIALAGGAAGDLGHIMLGGAAGSLIGTDHMDLPLTFEDSRTAGVALGSGVIMLFSTSVDMVGIVRRIAQFFRDESCGQCVPCRVGTVRVEEEVARASRGIPVDAGLIDDLDVAMKDASICGLGHTAASVVRSAIDLGILR